ncbi:MAG TPA: Gfo/Idh/MocA family oxidoreductase [Chthoniobacteraceae bacterium]|nr:Gfo/Idh/MocA family oxidoreductase [Chthoniobacteraceae bacterium]
MKKLRAGLIGLGGVGRIHFDCWRKCPDAELVAISARDPRKLAGDWGGQEFNLGAQAAQRVDLTGLATYAKFEDLIADPNVDVVDICLPTPLHAPVTIAALRAGKHVLCEKPMALSLDECAAMERTAVESGRRLMIAHCLRYSPYYLKAREILESGNYGHAVYANFQRMSGAPVWSGDGWFMRVNESGGVLDMHIHDIDAALWWFGRPSRIIAAGHAHNGLPLTVDAHWHYDQGPFVHLHSAWDLNGGTFRYAFKLVLEKATLAHDSAVEGGALQLIADGKTTTIAIAEANVHQAEIDDFARAVSRTGTSRVSPSDSRLAVEIGLEENRQIFA